jgi:tRNA(His) 5'-end guanylyltransferase
MLDIAVRMKQNYEAPAKHLLTRRIPVIVRVDGRHFHSYTKGLKKPFDLDLVYDMNTAAVRVIGDIQGCCLAYVQSDEASFLVMDDSTLETQSWVGYVKSKVETLSASRMTMEFNQCRAWRGLSPTAMFDSRAFSIPLSDVANYFLWRAMDWERNSLSMYCSAFYSHNEMEGKGKAAKHEMLHTKKRNWATDLSPQLRNGSFWIRSIGGGLKDWVKLSTILPKYAEIEALVVEATKKEEVQV